jgi:hypothetical protein
MAPMHCDIITIGHEHSLMFSKLVLVDAVVLGHWLLLLLLLQLRRISLLGGGGGGRY